MLKVLTPPPKKKKKKDETDEKAGTASECWFLAGPGLPPPDGTEGWAPGCCPLEGHVPSRLRGHPSAHGKLRFRRPPLHCPHRFPTGPLRTRACLRCRHLWERPPSTAPLGDTPFAGAGGQRATSPTAQERASPVRPRRPPSPRAPCHPPAERGASLLSGTLRRPVGGWGLTRTPGFPRKSHPGQPQSPVGGSSSRKCPQGVGAEARGCLGSPTPPGPGAGT